MRLSILLAALTTCLTCTARAENSASPQDSAMYLSSVVGNSQMNANPQLAQPVSASSDKPCTSPGRRVQRDIRGSIDGGSRCDNATATAF